MVSPDCFTYDYKTLDTGLKIQFDLYLPSDGTISGFQPKEGRINDSSHSADLLEVGAVVYFHGGGLNVANKRSWFPSWLYERFTSAGYAFISADYRLIPSGGTTAHSIIEDMIDLFSYLGSHTLPIPPSDATSSGTSDKPLTNGHGKLPKAVKVDMENICVAGTSAGGTCAYLAAYHIKPRPRVILSMYGMGGNFFVPQYLIPKTTPFYRGRDLLDPSDFKQFVHPNPEFLKIEQSPSNVIVDSPLIYHPADSTTHPPGYPANPRMLLSRLWFQLGTLVDYYSGLFPTIDENGSIKGKGISEKLREELYPLNTWDDFKSPNASTPVVTRDWDSKKMNEKARRIIPIRDRSLFPQLNIHHSNDVNSDLKWPPVCFAHGTEDTAVPVQESINLKFQLDEAGVETKLYLFEGVDHSFDYASDAEENYKEEMDEIARWLIERMK